MKNYEVTINEEAIYTAVYNITANAAAQRGDAAHVATEDNRGILTQKIFLKAVHALPEKQQMVFNLKYFKEMKYEEISEILGTSIGALKASYHHAIKKIEHFLKAHS